MAKMTRFLASFLSFLFFGAVALTIIMLFVIWHYESDLPDYLQLSDYKPSITTRLYAGDGSLLAEYAIEKRIFVPVADMPDKLTEAFIAAEDKNFYSHGGVDYSGLARAVITNIKNYGTGRRPVGASTITQQVAKNFLLTNEVSVTRKIKEALIAFKMERTFTKEHILELYLNEIYLGRSSYGVAAAALNYFNKSLDELTLGEMAFLAALPKAPNNYDPVRKKDAALARREWVLSRMLDDGYISVDDFNKAKDEPIVLALRDKNKVDDGEYFAEEVRREIAAKYGDDSLYQGGLDIRTSLDPNLQKVAAQSLQSGLINFDMKAGWRGPITHFMTREDSLKEQLIGDKVLIADIDEVAGAEIASADDSVGGQPDKESRKEPAKQGAVAKQDADIDLPFMERLKKLPVPPFAPKGWRMALVTELSNAAAKIVFADETESEIPLKGLVWARVKNPDNTLGPKVKVPSNVLEVNDVVWVEKVKPDEEGEEPYYALRQMPEVEGALIALDPNTGRVLAMAGGMNFRKSEFNRAVQAKRQPGSSFKPFVYMAALDSGYTPSTLILDAPFVLDQGPDKPKWKPSNYVKTYYGPTTLRVGLEKSRNLMTVRLAQAVGMRKVVEYAKKFGIVDSMPPLLAMSLGAGETTLLRLTAGYSMLVNGGKRVQPTFVDRIQDRTGATIYRHDDRDCPMCKGVEWENQDVPQVPDTREQIVDARSAYQMVNMLNGVMERGTGVSVRLPGKPLAGKTGTSDDYQDAWFIGFSADLVVGVFVGFDEPKSMGKRGSGATAAGPIFKSFMTEAVKQIPPVPFRVPEGIQLVRVNHKTGMPAKPSDKVVVLEAFKLDDDVTKKSLVIGEEASSISSDEEDMGAPDLGAFY